VFGLMPLLIYQKLVNVDCFFLKWRRTIALSFNHMRGSRTLDHKSDVQSPITYPGLLFLAQLAAFTASALFSDSSRFIAKETSAVSTLMTAMSRDKRMSRYVR